MERQLETSGFTSEGHDNFPSLYSDNKTIGNISEYTDTRLENLKLQYSTFLENETIMPRARETARRILTHIAFEQMYREGIFGGE